jgi:hypothetical protein
MKRIVVRLMDRKVRALAGMSKRCVAPVSALMRQAVDVYLQKNKETLALNRSIVTSPLYKHGRCGLIPRQLGSNSYAAAIRYF